MFHVIITEGTKVLLNEDYEALIGVGALVNSDDADAFGYVRALATDKMRGLLKGLLMLAERYAKKTVEAEAEYERNGDSNNDKN